MGEAIQILEVASTHNQGHPGTLLNLALAQAKAGHGERARALCQQLLKDTRASQGVRDQAARLDKSLRG